MMPSFKTPEGLLPGYQIPAVPDIPDRFSFPAFRHLLSCKQDATFRCSIQLDDGTAAKRPKTVAALLGRLSDDGTKAKLMSLLVDVAHRRRGLARALINRFLRWAEQQKTTFAEIRYTTRNKNVVGLEAALAVTGWSCPKDAMIFAKADPVKLMKQDWIERQSNCPPRLAAPFSWEEMTFLDRRSIARQIARGTAPSEVSPLWDEENIINDISLGLRRDGEVVGWMVCHSIPVLPGFIRYSRSFACPKRGGSGNGPWLMANAVKRHLASGAFSQNPRTLFDLMPDNKQMSRLFEKRIKPFAEEVYEMRISMFPFNAAASSG